MLNSHNHRDRWTTLEFGVHRAFAACAIAGLSLLSACSTTRDQEEPAGQVSFAAYRNEALRELRAERAFQSADKESEVLWNSPQEWRPASLGTAGKPQKGILLVHGLGDSPWSFHDLAEELASHGFLVRTVLLPGHGTRPEGLLNVTAEQWQRVVTEQAQALEQDVDGQVYLGGFSTGANLVLQFAYSHPEIAGLVLFSPGFKSLPFDWLAPLVSRIRPWLVSPDGSFPMQNPVRYMNVPTNGYAQFYRSSVAARQLLSQPYDKPVFMVVAQHDSVLDSRYLLYVFEHRFTNPQSRLIWYGTKPDGLPDTSRILIREDRIPEQHISQFSHMGLLFSPMNPLYGEKGSVRICLNGQAAPLARECEQGAPVWYSDWGYREEGKVHARLTFNPYFNWQTNVMMSVLDNQEVRRSAPGDASILQHSGDVAR